MEAFINSYIINLYNIGDGRYQTSKKLGKKVLKKLLVIKKFSMLFKRTAAWVFNRMGCSFTFDTMSIQLYT